MKNEYGKILKQNKLKINCNCCSSIYLDIVLAIDSVGKLKNYKLVKSKKCLEEFSKKLELEFINWFLKSIIPKYFYNLKFEAHLGIALK